MLRPSYPALSHVSTIHESEILEHPIYIYSPPTFGFALDRFPDGNDKASTTIGDLPSPFREACGGHAPAMP